MLMLMHLGTPWSRKKSSMHIFLSPLRERLLAAEFWVNVPGHDVEARLCQPRPGAVFLRVGKADHPLPRWGQHPPGNRSLLGSSLTFDFFQDPGKRLQGLRLERVSKQLS